MANECKFQRLEEKVSFDDGQTWESQTPQVYHKGGLVEPYSPDCSGGGDINERWTVVDGDYLCDGYNKYKKEILEVSYDGGVTWYPSYPLAARLGEFVEYDEQYCAYAAEIHYWVNDKYGCPFGCPSGYECRLVNGRHDCYRIQTNSSTTGHYRPTRGNWKDPIKIVKCPNDILTSSLLASDPYDIFYLRIGQCAHEIANRAVQDKVYFEYLDTTDAISLTRIGSYAFYGCSGLTVDGEQVSSGLQSVTVPSGVTDIGEYAFYGCSGLTDVVISNAPCSIGQYAFEGCTSLSGLTLGNSYTSIGYGAFRGCANITSNITIPSTVTSIGGQAFSGCSGITNITVQEGVTSIGGGAFNNTSITDLTIPNSVSGNVNNYSSSVFPSGCQYLTGVTIGSGITSAITDYFAASPVSYLSLNCSTVSRRSTSQWATLPFEHVILGNNVSNLNQNAFYEARQLTTVEIGSGITSISEGAFTLCTSLTSINIPSGVTSIGTYAFRYCKSLTSIDIPSGVTSIGYEAFQGCTSLTAITVNATTPPTLGYNAFAGSSCQIYVPCSSIGAYLAANDWSDYGGRITGIPPCEGLDAKYVFRLTGGSVISAYCDSTSAITTAQTESYKTTLASAEVGSCVSSIGNGTFSACTSLTSCTIENGVTSIGDKAFYRCSGLTSLVLPDTLTSTSSAMCSGCTSLTSINIPNGVTFIGEKSFCKCSGATSLSLPNSLTQIRDEAFSHCSGLTSVTIPSGVTRIFRGIFSYCGNLNTVTVLATTPPTLTDLGVKQSTIIYVPCESVDAYKSASGWIQYASRIRTKTKLVATYYYPSVGRTEVASICCNDSSTLTNSEISNLPNPLTAMTSAEIGSCVTSIGREAFYDCSGLTSVTIPNGVTSIGSESFQGCTSLTSIDIPSGVTAIGIEAFRKCTSLTSITVNAVTPPTLGSSALYGTPIAGGTGTIYVPAASVSSYQSARGWSAYASRIQAIP